MCRYLYDARYSGNAVARKNDRLLYGSDYILKKGRTEKNSVATKTEKKLPCVRIRTAGRTLFLPTLSFIWQSNGLQNNEIMRVAEADIRPQITYIP